MTPAALILIQAVALDPAMAAAVEARVSGRTAEAVAGFERLARERPADADVWLNLGLSYMAAQRWADADKALENALRLAPTYADVRVAYARGAFFAGDAEAARARLQPLLAAEPGHTEALELQRRLDAGREAAGPAWRLDIGHARSRLSSGLGEWTATSLGLSRRSGRDTVGLALEHTERFGREDLYAEAGLNRSFARGSQAFVALGGAPDADYRPEVAVRVGGSAPVGGRGPWRVRLGAEAAWQRYAVGDVRGLHPQLTLSGPGLELTARSINTLDERDDYRAGYSLRLACQPARRLTLFAGWADAPESSEGVTVDVKAASVGAAFELNAAASVRLDATHEDRRAYDRDEISVALTRRF